MFYLPKFAAKRVSHQFSKRLSILQVQTLSTNNYRDDTLNIGIDANVFKVRSGTGFFQVENVVGLIWAVSGGSWSWCREVSLSDNCECRTVSFMTFKVYVLSQMDSKVYSTFYTPPYLLTAL